jgi:hypothetical protein
MVTIKAFLSHERNRTRDFVGFAELAFLIRVSVDSGDDQRLV